jgi:small subunit ribosomal protein S1
MAITETMVVNDSWREIYASRQSRKILTGILSAIEKYKLNGKESDCGVVFYGNDIKVIIPAEEMGVREDWQVIRSMIGSEIDFIVYGIDTEEGVVAASRKAAQELRRTLELPKHKAGDIISARVVGVGRDSVIVDCYGLEVRIARNEIDYGYVGNAGDYVQIGDRVKAVIKEIDLSGDKPKVKLSLKDAKPDPFDHVPNKYKLGGEYLATVTGTPPFGIFAELEQGVSVLCPNPAWSGDEIATGNKVLVKVREINMNKRRIYGNLVRLIRRS